MSNSRDDDSTNHNPVIEECKLLNDHPMDGDGPFRSFAPFSGAAPTMHRSFENDMDAEVTRGMMSEGPVAVSSNFWDAVEVPDHQASAIFSAGQKGAWQGKSLDAELPPKPFLLPSKQLNTPFVLPSQGTTAGEPGFGQNVRPLKPTPEFYEKYSSFISRSPPGKLLAAICDTLSNASDCDHEFVKAKNKIRGVARMEPSGRARFVIKVYTHGADSLLVEFHRREGCVVTFNRFYQRILSGLGEHFCRRATSASNAKEEVSSVVSCPKPIMTLPMEEGETISCDVKQVLEKLCDEASCEYLDSQRQALGALAHLTSAAENRSLLDRNSSVAMLSKVLASNDEEVLENACRFLVNVCAEESCREHVVEHLLQELFSVLESPGALENWASKRHVAKAFAILTAEPDHANMMKKVFAESTHYVDTLRRYTQYHDQSLQQNIATALAQIEAA